jgi:hypothetical protein
VANPGLAKWIYHRRPPSIGLDYHQAFIESASGGSIKLAKWIAQISHRYRPEVEGHQEAIEINGNACTSLMQEAFTNACQTGNLKFAMWISHIGNLDLQYDDDRAFRSCTGNNYSRYKNKVIEWLAERVDDYLIQRGCEGQVVGGHIRDWFHKDPSPDMVVEKLELIRHGCDSGPDADPH